MLRRFHCSDGDKLISYRSSIDDVDNIVKSIRVATNNRYQLTCWHSGSPEIKFQNRRGEHSKFIFILLLNAQFVFDAKINVKDVQKKI